jgi:riboflavin kinase / FMN adenylyltransferase
MAIQQDNTLLDQVRAGDTLAFLHAARVAYCLEGTVVEGNKIGRTLGYPTANLQLDDPDITVPGQGVYTALVRLGDSWHESMVNIGIRPTLDLYNVTIEAHLFDFREDIYGERIAIHFLERIRDEMRFSSLSALKKQLDADRGKTRAALARMLPGLQKRGGQLVLRSS